MSVFRYVVAMAVAAVLVGACGQRDDVAKAFPDGSCATFSSTGNANHQQIGQVDCSGPHTHVVVAWVSRNAMCPSGSDAEFGTRDGKLCLRADAGPSASP